jgi:hypothetical protein
MWIAFPRAPADPTRVDPAFADEEAAARLIGFHIAWYDHDGLVRDGQPNIVAVTASPTAERRALLRGWMVPAEAYGRLREAALESELAFRFVVDSESYARAHYLPGWYGATQALTARSMWVAGRNPDKVWGLYQSFAHADALIKDWVKSAKGAWNEACFLPARLLREQFGIIFERFLVERGTRFNRGVVIREFLPFRRLPGFLGQIPRIEEHRIFFLHGRVLASTDGAPVDDIRWQHIVRQVGSPFMTIDVAPLDNREWRVIECGDGGVSGLAPGMDPTRFYAALWNAKV